jgi:glyoxylase-like metal-dependent hydrolase (beta-lactamase superfamily II)
VLINFLLQPIPAAVPMLPVGKTIQIAERVFVIPDQRVPLVPNVGIIVGDDGVLVVDTGMGPANAAIVLDEVRKITDKPVRYLVSTHFHPEHNFGAQAFPEETVIIYATAQHQDLINKGRRYLDWFVEMFGDDVRGLLEPVELIAPDITFASKAEINLGGLRVELLHFGKPAHTNGDTLVYLPAAKILFAGGLVPVRFFPILPDADSSGRGWIESLEAMEQLEIDTVVPGHGEPSDRRQIQAVRAYLSSLESRVAQLRAENQSLEQIQAALAPEFEAKYPDWEDSYWIKSAVQIFYAERAPDE